MIRLLLILLTCSFLVNIVFIYSKIDHNRINHEPPWEPFELNSDLTLESLVKDGYRFGAMPCGQVQFYKTMGDTTIQYEVGIDCKTYIEEEETDILYKATNRDNPYYPFTFDKVKNCYQGINWRIYRFRFNDPNRKELNKFIKSKNCRIISETENWDGIEGGSFVVYNPNNSLYFFCTITKENLKNKNKNKLEWEFKIISDIPYLDAKRRVFESERRERINQFYESQ